MTEQPSFCCFGMANRGSRADAVERSGVTHASSASPMVSS
jgi:hypothetical protein